MLNKTDQREAKDHERWVQFLNGDDHAFTTIYADYSGTLYQYGQKFTRDRHFIEDSIHDLFVYLVKHRHKLGPTDNILFYLMKSFKRLLIKQLKKNELSDTGKRYESWNFSVTFSIEQEIMEGELSGEKVNMLARALENLTPRQKEAIYLRFSKELDYHSMAEIMGIKVEACRNLISAAVKTLKKILQGENNILLFSLFHKINPKK